jgi:phosphotransferase system enzyme I (PtsP)
MALLAIGYRSLSMSPAAIGPVKAMLLSLNVGLLSETLLSALDGQNADEMTIPELLTDFADRHGIPY